MAPIIINAWNHKINDYSMMAYATENICSSGHYPPSNTNQHSLLHKELWINKMPVFLSQLWY